MEIKNYRELNIKLVCEGAPEDEQNKMTNIVNDIWNKILEAYRKAETFEQFENNFFLIWYMISNRQSFIPFVEGMFNQYKIGLPEYFFQDKNLYKNLLTIDNDTEPKSLDKKIKNKKLEYLNDVIDIGNSRIEIRSDKPKDFKTDIENDLRHKEENKIFNKINEEAESLLPSSNSYQEYLLKLKPIYYKIYELGLEPLMFELYRWNVTFNIPRQKEDWKNVPIVSPFALKSEEIFSQEEAEAYIREEELSKQYEDEKYIYRTLIYNDDYNITDREKFINELVELFKSNNNLLEFVSKSVEKQVNGFTEKIKEYISVIKTYKEEKISLYEDLLNEVNTSNLKEEEKEKFRNKFEKIRNKYMPESKSYKDLIKNYFKIAFQINEIPVLDQLDSSVYSKSSWSRLLRNLNFLVMLKSECEKRLNKKLKDDNKKLVIDIKNHILSLAKGIQGLEISKTGLTCRDKPNFDDNIFDNDEDS